MIANYHTHTWRCKHAEGTEREYVENAIRGGLKILGFSDHTPYPFEGGYVSPVKMDMEQLEDYVDTVSKLRDEYKKDIEIRIGLEAEYYPYYWDRLLDVTEQYPIEYFILGQHFLGNEIGETFCGVPNQSVSDLKAYRKQSEEALKTGLFTYFAHPDVFHFTGSSEDYDREMRGLCHTAKELGIPLEINLLGLQTNRHYPNDAFWKIAGEVGNEVVLGSDAHFPENVYRPDTVAAGEALAARFGLTLLETVELKTPHRT